MIFLNTPLQEGFIILIIGMGIVFISLLVLFLVFEYGVPFFIKSVLQKSKKKHEQPSEIQTSSFGSGEEMAAICTAVYMMLEEAHDQENAIITISKSEKVYSPWSSKIYVTHNMR